MTTLNRANNNRPRMSDPSHNVQKPTHLQTELRWLKRPWSVLMVSSVYFLDKMTLTSAQYRGKFDNGLPQYMIYSYTQQYL